MSDEDSPARDYPAELAEARRVAEEALSRLEKAAWRVGFNEGFHAGWEAGRKRLREMMEEASAQPETLAQTRAVGQAVFTPQLTRPSVRAADVVFDVIRLNPGVRGVDIVKAAGDRGTPLLERTTRTALYRMKRDGQVKNLDGRWYVADAAPDPGNDKPEAKMTHRPA